MGLLAVPFVFAFFALFFGGVWFISGVELTPQGHWLWPILERGSLAAIEAVAKILGVGNILFGWIYAERNKLTLGKSQLELIEYQFGPIYTWSVAVHFFVTALCLLLAESGAREGAFFSFLALSGGCVPQVMICVEIGLNQKNREECSIKLWEDKNCSYKDPAVIDEMIRYLGDPSVSAHEGYRNVLFKKIADWLSDFPEILNSVPEDKMAADIRMISDKLHTLLETVPELEQEYFSEMLFRSVFRNLDGIQYSARAYPQVELLCCGYIHNIYNMNKMDGTLEEMDQKIDAMASRISSLTYYFQNQGIASSYGRQFLQKLLGGLEWYLFLSQRIRQPRYAVYQNVTAAQVDNIFVALIYSIFDLTGQNSREYYAKIAWKQV